MANPRRAATAISVLIGAVMLAAIPALAHHYNSAYDRSAAVTVTGIVKRWQFINPHAGLFLDVVDGNGHSVEWSVEFQGTLDLYRHFSWNRETFKPGDMITITGFPARDGTPSLGARIVVFADGTEVDVRSAPD